eukprot:3357802-Rhodomonas_salina.3
MSAANLPRRSRASNRPFLHSSKRFMMYLWSLQAAHEERGAASLQRLVQSQNPGLRGVAAIKFLSPDAGAWVTG